jgi:hypothetical protein
MGEMGERNRRKQTGERKSRNLLANLMALPP